MWIIIELIGSIANFIKRKFFTSKAQNTREE